MRSMIQTDLMFSSDASLEASGIMLMKVLNHPGHGNSNCCVVGNWTWFRFLEVSPLFKWLLQFLLTGGELQAFKLRVGVSSQSR